MTRSLTAALCLVASLSTAVLADNPLGLAQHYPDIATFDLNVSYVYSGGSGTGVLTVVTSPTVANSAAQFRETSGSSPSPFFSHMEVQVTVDGSGNLVSDPGNTLSIASLNAAPPVPTFTTLLAGDVAAFGWTTGGGGTLSLLEFSTALTTLYSNTGIFEAYPTPVGEFAGTIMTVGNNTFTNWTTDFTAAVATSYADNFVPEPASMALLGVGAVLAMRRRRAA